MAQALTRRPDFIVPIKAFYGPLFVLIGLTYERACTSACASKCAHNDVGNANEPLN